MSSTNAALNIACAHCGAQPGMRCTVRGTGQPLKHSAAHPSRYEAAGMVPDIDAVDKARKAWATAEKARKEARART